MSVTSDLLALYDMVLFFVLFQIAHFVVCACDWTDPGTVDPAQITETGIPRGRHGSLSGL